MTACVFIGLLIAAILGLATPQNVYTCPNNWVTNGGFCYRFEINIPATYDDARAACNLNGAGLLSISDTAENSFISQWLQQNNPSQDSWYTSGVPDTKDGIGFIWESTGEPVQAAFNSSWLEPPPAQTANMVIIYTYGKTGYGWALSSRLAKIPYICKISEQEAYRIMLTNRGFDYGIVNPDIGNLEQGPHFIEQPQSVVVISQPDIKVKQPVSLNCVVKANPQATYRWFRGQNLDVEITDKTDSRYGITNGLLTISQPDEAKDSNLYQCRAENKFGTVISSVAEISFGSLGEFNNVKDAGTKAKAFEGATVECSRIDFRPAVSYQWYKSNFQFIRPQFQTYIFISNNGKLYFSEVTRTDEDEYSCIATLTGVNRYTIGTDQPPTKTSLPIPLTVADQTPLSNWGPKIQNDFIAVFPKPAMRGQDVRLECFAYGSLTSKFTYDWERLDKPMPATAKMSDQNRVLTISSAQLEDSGIYRCSVRRDSQSDSKEINLQLEATPYFISELQDQHADINSQLTWICNARGRPEPTYQWYKNGVPITAQSDVTVRVQKNVLTITKLSPDLHNGMYQCGVQNVHGLSLSNAQLRVLAFSPNIDKYPPPRTIMAAEGGNITLRCQPEGSPFPTITWQRGGSPITSDGVKYTIFGNGNLHITEISSGDRGVYTCMAENIYGKAEASTNMDTTNKAVITMAPSDQTAVVNRTVFLVCEATFPKNLDLVYEWTFNGYTLFFDLVNFKQVQNGVPGTNGLYIMNANFDHEGVYTCTARTPFSAESRTAYLTIKGPPRQPAGVNVLTKSITQTSATVMWTEGSAGGGIISAHIVQAANEFEPDTWEDVLTISVGDSFKQNSNVKDKHEGSVTVLNPGTGYRFRVIAQNEYGLGIPSDPSEYIQTFSAPPRIAPNNVGGGGGSVGDLTISWEPLKRSEYGIRDNSVGYRVYWRRKSENFVNTEGSWNLIVVNNAAINYTVTQVGADYYYLLYETKVQAFSSAGMGPNSSVVEIYSAEDLPLATPFNVRTSTFNSSCLLVEWDPVPDDRLNARGKILGYVLNYYDEEYDPATTTQSIRYYGNVGEGLVIGLESQVNTVVDVQVYNSAGLGPRSNTYIMETARLPALTYSQEVHVASAGYSRCRVWWRGITTKQIEEDITGWRIWLWTANENFLGADIIDLVGTTTLTTLHNISEHRLYAMRIAAMSFGGIGKKTPTVYFTTEGQIMIDPRFAETIQAYRGRGVTTNVSFLFVLVCFLITSLKCQFL